MQWIDRIPGGYADAGPPPGVALDQVRKGIAVEMEHTNDRRIAREIAMDHLWEDPAYYDKLALVENGQCCPCNGAGVGPSPSTTGALVTVVVLLGILASMPIIGSITSRD